MPSSLRRHFLTTSLTAATAAAMSGPGTVAAEEKSPSPIVLPKSSRGILLSCKLGMIAREAGGKQLTIAERLQLAA